MATTPLRLPDLAFEDADGKPKKLSDWRGKTVLVNLWATWCVPCRKEMPALEGLQTKLGGPNFEVVAINIDTRDPEKPKNFLKDANLTRLGYFSDQKAKVFQDLKAIGRALGMPTSVLVDGQGCEIAHHCRPGRMGQRRRGQADQGRGEAGRRGVLGRSTSRLPPMPAPTLASEVALGRPEQGQDRGFLGDRVRLQHGRRDLLLACRRPAAARRPRDHAHMSIRNTPSAEASLSRRGVNECWNRDDRRRRIVAIACEA